MRTSCRQGPHLSILPNTSARCVLWLKSFVVSPSTPCISLPLCVSPYCPLWQECSSCTLARILPICRPLILWTPLLGIFPGPHLFPRQWWLPLYPVYGACHVCSWESGLTGTSSAVLPDCKPLEERVQVSLIFLSFRPRDVYLLDSQ